MDLADIVLPAFLDPFLDFLSQQLPPPLYSFLLSFLSHSLALLSALLSLTSSLFSSTPWQWDAQTIIPPLISLLAAYLALVSLYRTTSWMIRTSIWLVKWGSIFGALTAGLGWYMGNQHVGVGSKDVISRLGGFILDLLNSEGQQHTSNAQPSSRRRTQHDSNDRPKPWESFRTHRQEHDANQEGNEAQKIMANIMKATHRLLSEGGWWDIAKGVFERPLSDEAPPREDRRRTKTTKRNS